MNAISDGKPLFSGAIMSHTTAQYSIVAELPDLCISVGTVKCYDYDHLGSFEVWSVEVLTILFHWISACTHKIQCVLC